MSLIIHVAVTIFTTALQVYGRSDGATQPGCNVVPTLPSNFSTKRDHWPHATKLLRDQWQQSSPPIAARQDAAYWSGWQSVQYIFAFGDSYTSTNFTIAGEQPNPSNPLGNPVYPGATSANGPNFIDFLTTTYNESYIQTYNLGYGGATIDPLIVGSPFGPTVKSFYEQVHDEFLPTYTHNSSVPWNSSNSLFTVFFGINDVVNSFAAYNDSINYELIKAYENIVNELYAAGARNILFMNVPPVDRTPGALSLSSPDRAYEAGYVGAFNFRLGALIYNLALRHPDTAVFSFDTNYLFTRVLDDPAQFQETAGYRNTTNYCEAYLEWVLSDYTNGSTLQAELTTISGTSTLTYLDPSCGVPVNEYLWLNTLHPTYPMHNFMASQIVQLLGA